MGIGRGRATLPCLLFGLATLLLLAGCGAEDHPNDPRPPLSAQVTVSIQPGRLSIQPNEAGYGNDNQAMSQNDRQAEPELSSDRPLTVTFTVANLTDFDTPLQIEGPASESTNKVIGNGTGTFKVDLPTGEYLIAATGVPGSPDTTFSVGPRRISSQNDLLLP